MATDRELAEILRAVYQAARRIEEPPAIDRFVQIIVDLDRDAAVGIPLPEGAGYRFRQNKGVAHLWDGTDTFCRMWSTVGLSKGKKWVTTKEAPAFKSICTMCANAGKAREDDEAQR